MVGGEGGGLAIFGGHHGRGGSLAPVDSLRRLVEVPLAGVVFHAAHHPGHRAGVTAHVGQAPRRVRTGPLQGGHFSELRDSGHQSVSQSGWY